MMARIFLILVSIFFSNQSYASSPPKVIIKNCYDGDTCTTTKGEKIRLACIDTPELKGPKAKPIKAKEAKGLLE